MHSFARNWQLPFLNQRKGENDRRKYFMINLHERMLPRPWGHVECGQFTEPHIYWAGLVLLAVNQYCAHSFARNWQLPFLNQRKGENDRRKYFTINLHERMLPTSAGVKPATSWSPVGRASNWATEAGIWWTVTSNIYELLDNMV